MSYTEKRTRKKLGKQHSKDFCHTCYSNNGDSSHIKEVVVILDN